MKNKKIFFSLTAAALVVAGLVINSCKKDNQNSVQVLLTRGKWQLASVMVFNRLGSSTISTDTLNVNCDSTQIFTFNTNNTCSYSNFECIPQKTNGNWTLSSDQLTLTSDILCKDTLIGGKADSVKRKPFQNTKIVNLGQYSMVLQTGDVNTFITSTTKSRVIQYGFVHQTTN
ncbi:MAG: hypothetical protein ACHQF4_03720 [Sphingobacteriales bacterium]